MLNTFAHSERMVKSAHRYLRREFAAEPCYQAAMKLRIKDFRVARGLTVEELAARVAMSKSYVSEIENGKKRVNDRRLEAFAKALGVTVRELIVEAGDDASVMAHLDTYRQLSSASRAAIEQHALALLSQQKPV